MNKRGKVQKHKIMQKSEKMKLGKENTNKGNYL